MVNQWDCVVVGAGPAGATSALLLARAGARVLVVERLRFPRSKVCAEYMSPGVGRTLDQLGLASISEEGKVVPGMDIISPRGQRLRIQYQEEGAAVHARTLARQRLDALLLEAAAAAGASVLHGFVAKRAISESARVRGVSGTRLGREESFRAPILIVADGARSSTVRSLGLAMALRWPVRLGLVSHFQGEATLSNGYGQMHVRNGGYCGIAPLPNHQVNVAVVVRNGQPARQRQSAQSFFQSWVQGDLRVRDTLAGCKQVGPVRGLAPVGARVSAPGVPGALLVGDAAGFFDPFTGEGIYRAIVGAQIASRICLTALEGPGLDPHLISEYRAARRSAFRTKSMVTALVQMFVQFPQLMEYASPRLASRATPSESLSAVLGDLRDARDFLSPSMLWATLRP